MHHRKSRRHRYHSNDRGYKSRDKIGEQIRQRSNSFRNGRGRNNIKIHQSAEKLAEKYNALAKEALSSGDNISSENYFQHADHFMRIIDSKNSNQNQDQNKIQVNEGTKLNDGYSSESNEITQNQSTEEKKNKNSE